MNGLIGTVMRQNRTKPREPNPRILEIISCYTGRTKCAMIGWYALALGDTRTGLAAFSVLADDSREAQSLLRRPNPLRIMAFLHREIHKGLEREEWLDEWDELTA